MGFRRFMFHGVTKGTSLRCLEHAPAAGAGRSGGLAAGRPRGEPAVRDGAARERGRRRSTYEAPHGSVAPGPRFQRRRIEAETVPPLPCTAVSGHVPRGPGVFRPKGCASLEACGFRRYAPLMGLTHMRLQVGNVANPEMTEELDFLVDSGAIYSVVPREVLGRLGVQPLGQQEFRLANGARIVREKGVALFRYGDRVGGADVIFGEPEDALLLGAFTLESLGLCLDPLRRELLPVPMILAVWARDGRVARSAGQEIVPHAVGFRLR